MFAGAKESLAQLATKVSELYRELVTTTVKFEEVRKYTKESIDEFKRLLERQEDKVERIERERIRAETELRSKIDALDARLNALSERALHAAISDAAVDYARKAIERREGEQSGQKQIEKRQD